MAEQNGGIYIRLLSTKQKPVKFQTVAVIAETIFIFKILKQIKKKKVINNLTWSLKTFEKIIS